MKPDRLDLVMAHLNPRASISLPDCLDMEGCHLVVPHAAVHTVGTTEETPDDEEPSLEDAPSDSFPKPSDSEEIEEEKEMEDKSEEVEFIKEVQVQVLTLRGKGLCQVVQLTIKLRGARGKTKGTMRVAI